MNDLLKEAIADAKAVRETALANAKLALEEAFTPRLQSMLSAKLSEEEGIEDEPVAEDEMPMDAAPVEEPVEEPAVEEPVAESDHGYEGEEELADDADEDPTDVHSEEADAELEEILRELEGEDEEAPVAAEGRGDDEAVEEQSDSSDIGKGDNKVDLASSSDEEDPGKGKLAETEGEGDAEDVDLEEIIRALKEEDGEEEVTEDQDTAGVDDGAAAAELEEAYKVIRFMKSKLNEVNLLNAKLLFSNKLFRNHNLNEGQKMKVIENFDRAQTLREVKLVFATLSESFRFGRTKKTIKESYASKATRSTKPAKRVISEGNTLANRWKKLANLA
jgi:hypothetical protein